MCSLESKITSSRIEPKLGAVAGPLRRWLELRQNHKIGDQHADQLQERGREHILTTEPKH